MAATSSVVIFAQQYHKYTTAMAWKFEAGLEYKQQLN